MTLPSKELLKIVLKVERPIDNIAFIERWSTIIYFVNGGNERTINIYELAHKVKEWALKQGYRIASQLIERGITIDIGMNGFAVVHTCNREVNKEREDTELEAVFAAGEWVLNQQDKGI